MAASSSLNLDTQTGVRVRVTLCGLLKILYMKADYSKENLEKLTKEAWCFNDLGIKLGLKHGKKKKLKEKLDNFGIDYSHFRKIPIKDFNDDLLVNNSPYQQRIKELRLYGKSYAEIAKEVGCSKSTVSYYLRNKSRAKVVQRKFNRPYWIRLLSHKLDTFKHRSQKTITKRIINPDWNEKLRVATSKFSSRNGMKEVIGYKDVLKKYNQQTIITDYISGEVIDITKDNYAFDHIIPVSRGGTNKLDNLAIVSPITNKVKSDLTKDELLDFCKKIWEYNGYKVEK